MSLWQRLNSQSGNVAMAIVIFFAIFIFIELSLPKTKSSAFVATQQDIPQGGCIPYSGANPPIVKLTGQALPRKIGSVYRTATEAKLVLSNLYINVGNMDKQASDIIDKSDDGDILINSSRSVTVNGQPFLLLYPSNHVEINDTNKSAVSFGLVFLAKIDDTGNLIVNHIQVKTSAFEFKSGDYLLTDVYQVPNSKPISQDLIDTCIKAAALVNPGVPSTITPPQNPGLSVTFPEQKVSPDKKQQQLQWFLFEEPQTATTAAGFWSLHCKPAIYLYPPSQMAVNVKVNTKGSFTYTDPKYPEGGWDVIAHPDGTLEYPASSLQPLPTSFQPPASKKYPYLYYESKVPDDLIDVPSTGYTTSFSDLPNLYQTLLPQLGLNDQQTKDFVDYWKKALPYSPYYFVGVMDQQNINNFEPLQITPQPDSINRVRIYFKALDKMPANPASSLQLPASSFQPPASSFKVTEWGGMVKRDLLHPFTCSQ